MRKFFGPMGTMSRVTIEGRALKTKMLGDRRPASSTLTRHRDTTETSNLVGLRAAACRVRAAYATRSRRRPSCRAGDDSLRTDAEKREILMNDLMLSHERRTSRGARPSMI